MNTLHTALQIIRRFEGLRLTAYRDSGGVWTIGYGHTSRAGPPKVMPGMRITRREAEEILRRDVEKFARGVEEAIEPGALRRLNANQFGALVSFAYNVGLGNFRRSSVLRAVNEGRLEDVPRLLMHWTKARRNGRLVRLRGLVRRRRAEGRLFMAPPAHTMPMPVGEGGRGGNVRAKPPLRPGRSTISPWQAAVLAAFFMALTTIATIIWKNRLMRFIRRLLAPLKGWRTYAFALFVAALGVAEATDWAQIVPDGQNKGVWLLGISLAIAFLRTITTTPPGRSTP